ncbi:MAG: hypothetical protein V2A62_00750 [Candidatus Woesearchaeota archaeon]
MPYWNVDEEKKQERELKRYEELRVEHSRRFTEITQLSSELDTQQSLLRTYRGGEVRDFRHKPGKSGPYGYNETFEDITRPAGFFEKRKLPQKIYGLERTISQIEQSIEQKKRDHDRWYDANVTELKQYEKKYGK